jgi:hypothetical protein
VDRVFRCAVCTASSLQQPYIFRAIFWARDPGNGRLIQRSLDSTASGMSATPPPIPSSPAPSSRRLVAWKNQQPGVGSPWLASMVSEVECQRIGGGCTICNRMS